jgi:uncharacterized protein involved in outer membrane biogenesis
MRRLLKWVFRLVILAVVLIVVLVLSLDPILRVVAERQVRSETGMDVKIGKFSVSLLSPVVTIRDFKLYNTAEFGGSVFIDIPELHVEYDREALARQQLHIKLMRFNLAELSVVRNEAGRTNIVEFMKRPSAKSASRGGGFKQLGEVKFTGIDVLNLSLGKVRCVDLKSPNRSLELKVNARDQIFKNVKTENDVYGMLAVIWLRYGISLDGNSVLSPSQFFPSPKSSKPRAKE